MEKFVRFYSADSDQVETVVVQDFSLRADYCVDRLGQARVDADRLQQVHQLGHVDPDMEFCPRIPESVVELAPALACTSAFLQLNP
jgi:hypothetical protein